MPWIPKMRQTIAGALGLQEAQVNVKAKTAERMGPVGEGRSIEARHSAVVLLVRANRRRLSTLVKDQGARCSWMRAARPPALRLTSCIAPPMRWMFFSTMARPSPAPVAAVRAVSPRKKALVRCASAAGGHAGAVVAHLQQHPLLVRTRADLDLRHAGIRAAPVAHRVLQQVGDDAHQLHRIGQHLQRGRYIHRAAHDASWSLTA
jgi:hypothetical protein